jgi:UDP-N-acetylmuramoyl-tripeptide--D-alanyl-D-alanine ligase
VEAVARENGAVISSLPTDGTAVFPADDEYAYVWRELAGDRATLSFALTPHPNPLPQGERELLSPSPLVGEGLGRGAAINGSCYWQAGAWQVTASTPQGEISYALHMAGKHNVKNSLAAVACAIAAGSPVDHIQQGLQSFTAVAGRSRTVQLGSGDAVITLVDDTYNANPDSVIAAIDMLMDLPAPRLLILGDMGEVGDAGPAFHAEVGAYAKARGVDMFWTLGELCKHAGATHFADMESLLAASSQLGSGDESSLAPPCTRPQLFAATPCSILVKGSRFMKMERVVRHLEQKYLENTHAA